MKTSDKSAVLERDGFEGSDDAQRRVCQHVEFMRYYAPVKRRPLWEEYRDGDVSIVFDLDVWKEIEVDQPHASKTGHRRDFISHAFLVFHANAHGTRAIDDWKQQFVFVRDIEIVKSPEVDIPSTVRLYVGGDLFEESGTGLVYLSPRKRVIKHLRSLPERELPELSLREFESVDRLNPGVIQGGSQVVDSIASRERNIDEAISKIGAFVLDRLSSGFFLPLDGRSVIPFQREGKRLNFSDVLIGPVNL